MPRRKPESGKQHKAELQLKRAVKRGDAPSDAVGKGGPASRGRRGAGHGRQTSEVTERVQASRRLQSAFVKLSPEFLEEAKRKASELALDRPISLDKALYPSQIDEASTTLAKLSVIKRPKWNYEMTKKMVEANEEGVFKKWLDQTDAAITSWRQHKFYESPSSPDAVTDADDLKNVAPQSNPETEMPFSAPLYEQNIEVWRQLWRVTEVCQILLILLDSRCPPLHYPPSLHDYLSSSREPRKVIFILTKIDISGTERSDLWQEYLHARYPDIKIVKTESYQEKEIKAGQGKRKFFEPYIPSGLRRNLVDALKSAHEELCTPPPSIAARPERSASWKPRVVRSVDWDAVMKADNGAVSSQRPDGTDVPEDIIDNADVEGETVPDYISVGLMGQPNVGKSSLLNALFGTHKVKASKTPGKTKHFQTLFWTNQIRLVDCPGLVFPGYVDMELQVLAGILPISQIPAIPSTMYLALQYLPLEEILGLEHPGKKEAQAEDKRTWREGSQGTSKKAQAEMMKWTAMDVLTAFAEKQNWVTAKAGRPDVNRAGNAILRAIAEGRIKWSFYPPDYDVAKLPQSRRGKGIWVDGVIEDDIVSDESDQVDEESSDEESEELEETRLYDSDEGEAGDEEESVTKLAAGQSKFSALAIDDDDDDDE